MAGGINTARQFRDWFVHDALPLWAQRGYDQQHGGFYETLDFSGAPTTGQTRRVRVQTRQIYTFTLSALRGWGNEYEALAATGFEYFLKFACPNNGTRGCAHTLAEDGSILDNRRDLYDQAFLLLTCAARWEAARDDRAIALAESTLSFMDSELTSAEGGWLEDDAGGLPRRQNPHMHLFEAFLALYEATQDQRYLDYADKIFLLFTSFFYDQKNKILREFFNPDLSPLDDTSGHLIEPGHMAEWVWLLDRYSKAGKKISQDMLETLFDRATQIGADENNFLIDSVNLKLSNTAQTRRLWPQTEYVKAAFALARRADNPAATNYANLATEMINRITTTYLNQPIAGLWCDQYTLSGEPNAANVPASILYHLFEAVQSTSDFLTTTE